jgi:flagellar biosynthesis component FlhA
VWLPVGDAEAVGDGGVDPYAFILRHVEAAVRAQLETFFGIPELGILIERNLGPDDQILANLLQEQTMRVRLVAATLNLLREGVPVRSIGTLLRTLSESTPGEHVDSLRERMRIAVAPELPGIADNRARLALGVEVEQRMAKRLIDAGGRQIVALPRGEARELAEAVAHGLTDSAERRAIVVVRSELRTGLWRLLRARTPRVAVLSSAETDAAALSPNR